MIAFFFEPTQAQEEAKHQTVIPLSHDMQHEIETYQVLDKWFEEFEEIIQPLDKDVVLDVILSKMKDHAWLSRGLQSYCKEQEDIITQDKHRRPLEKDNLQSYQENIFDDRAKVHVKPAYDMQNDSSGESRVVSFSVSQTKVDDNRPASSSDSRGESLLSTLSSPVSSFMMSVILPSTLGRQRVVLSSGDTSFQENQEDRQQQPSTLVSVQNLQHDEGGNIYSTSKEIGVKDGHISYGERQELTEASFEGVVQAESLPFVLPPYFLSPYVMFATDKVSQRPVDQDEGGLETSTKLLLHSMGLDDDDVADGRTDKKEMDRKRYEARIKDGASEGNPLAKLEEVKEDPEGMGFLMTSAFKDLIPSLTSLFLMTPSLPFSLKATESISSDTSPLRDQSVPLHLLQDPGYLIRTYNKESPLVFETNERDESSTETAKQEMTAELVNNFPFEESILDDSMNEIED